jgi:tetratricopeptide (TPR) repeat protein
MISFSCSGCQRALAAADHLAGKHARCTACKALTPIPAPAGVTAVYRPAAAPPTAPPGNVADAPTLPPARDEAITLFPAASQGETLPPSDAPRQAGGPDALDIPGYEVLGELGRGGMGVVYRARQLQPRRLVALKVVLAGEHASAEALARFRAEAAAAARLQHPGIVAVHEVGEHDGRPFFSLELVEGGNLASLLGGQRLRPQESAALVLQVARAVQAAHDKGIVHRDLKPANILLAEADEGSALPWRAKVTDFGLSKQLDEMASVAPGGPRTASGAVMGTPAYMAPEQASGRTADVGPAADVWALGAVLYECLTGRPPFQANSLIDTLLKVAAEEPAPPRRLNRAVPRDLETVCLKCLRKAPGDRYASARALADDLRRFLDGRPVQARPPGRLRRAGRWLARRKALLYGGGSAVLAACLSVTALLIFRPAPVRPPPGPPADLRLVPRDAHAVFCVRAAELWQRPDLRAVVADLGPPGAHKAAPEARDELARWVRALTGVEPGGIERATVVMRGEQAFEGRLLGGGPQPLVILLGGRPLDLAAMRQALRPVIGASPPRAHRGWSLYADGPNDNGPCFCPVSDRVVLYGRTGDVRWALDGGGQPPGGPIDEAVAFAAEGAGLAVGVRFTPAAARRLVDAARLPAAPQPLLRLAGLSLAARLGPPAEGRWLPDLQAHLSLRFPDEASAAQALPAARAGLGNILRAAEQEAGEAGPGLPPLLLSHLRGPGEWRQDGAALHYTLHAHWTDEQQRTLVALRAEERRYPAAVDRLQAIGQALAKYRQANGTFPPAVVTSPRGEPLYSWRVAILPYTAHAQAYRKLHAGRAWDHPANKEVLARAPELFTAPGEEPGPWTAYRAVVGPDAGFGERVSHPLKSFKDGLADTILVVESAGRTHWAAPDDVRFVKGPRPPGVGGVFRAKTHVLMADGSVVALPASPPDALLSALCTRAGGERAAAPGPRTWPRGSPDMRRASGDSGPVRRPPGPEALLAAALEAAGRHPTNAGLRKQASELANNRAWALVTGPPANWRPGEALPLAWCGVALVPEESNYLNTLGVVLVRNGDYRQARAILRQSLAVGAGRSAGFDLFFLAVCYARLGEPAEANACFDQAVWWVREQKNLAPQQAAELRAFRAEAEGVLGLARPPRKR